MKKIFFLPALFILLTAFFMASTPTGAVAAEKKAQSSKKAASQEKQEQDKGTAQDPDYLIGIEDVLEISVWKNPEISKTVQVRPDGMITLPLIGDVKASGLTPIQLREEINNRLKAYQETAITSVIVQDVRSYKIFVLGEVLNPGTYMVSRRTTLLQAIAMAGGLSQFASNSIVLVRENLGEETEKIKIRFSDIVDEDEKRDKNVVLKPGDTLFVR
ncbi:MAG: hypothetical protein A3I81_06765 [Deltaproteobacteria bacterium RIFCSPLOWO2_02_FULL_55_12]|nr:MAG: hypothetical protein A3I81_06765 [Deltaproteobacteria bacterium RIFCSPLOWO2_02_FULL_55_12]